MFLQSELLGLLIRDFPARLVSLVPQKADLDVGISLLSDILEPVAHMFEAGAFGDVVNDDGSVHFAIVAGWGRGYLGVREGTSW